MQQDILTYHNSLTPQDKAICDTLYQEICFGLPMATHKIWHAHPVWFLEQNPIVGYSKLKSCIRLLFWSGQSFNESDLQNEGKFKAAEFRYTAVNEINTATLQRCLQKSIAIQWDYKNIVKRKGILLRLTDF